jgi:hypothetical protein
MTDRGSLSGPGWAASIRMPSLSRPARKMTLRGDGGFPATGGRLPSDHRDRALRMLQHQMGDRTTQQLGKATATAAEHEQPGPFRLLDECFAHLVVVADQLYLELDLGEPAMFGLQRPEEMVAFKRLHAVYPGHESRIAPHGRGPDPHGGQRCLAARRSLESKLDRLCRKMRTIHTSNNSSGCRPKIAVGGRRDDDQGARSMGRQGAAHRPLWEAGEAVRAAATHHEEFGVLSLGE